MLRRIILSFVLGLSFAWGFTPQPAAADPIACPNSAAISVSASGNTQLVAASSGQRIFICSFSFQAAGAVNVQFVDGTGTNCGTGTANLTGAYPEAANTGVAAGSGAGALIVVPFSTAFCINLSAAVSVAGVVSYGYY